MSEIEKIERYIDRTKISQKSRDAYCMSLDDMRALYEGMRRNQFHTMSLIFNYGQAKGYRAAKAEARRA